MRSDLEYSDTYNNYTSQSLYYLVLFKPNPPTPISSFRPLVSVQLSIERKNLAQNINPEQIYS